MRLNVRMSYEEEILAEKMSVFLQNSKYEFTDLAILEDDRCNILVVELFDKNLNTFHYVTRYIVNNNNEQDDKLFSMCNYIESDDFSVSSVDGNSTLSANILGYFLKMYLQYNVKRDICDFLRIRKSKGDFVCLIGHEDDHITMTIPRARMLNLLKGNGKHDLLCDYFKKTELDHYGIEHATDLEVFGIRGYEFVSSREDYDKDPNAIKFLENKNDKMGLESFSELIKKGVKLHAEKHFARYSVDRVKFLDLCVKSAGKYGYIIDSVFIIDHKYVHVYYKFISHNEFLVAGSKLETSNILRQYYIEHIVRVACLLGNVTLSGLADLSKYVIRT